MVLACEEEHDSSALMMGPSSSREAAHSFLTPIDDILSESSCCTSALSGAASLPAPTLAAGGSVIAGNGAAPAGTLVLDRLCVSGASFRTPSSVPS